MYEVLIYKHTHKNQLHELTQVLINKKKSDNLIYRLRFTDANIAAFNRWPCRTKLG